MTAYLKVQRFKAEGPELPCQVLQRAFKEEIQAEMPYWQFQPCFSYQEARLNVMLLEVYPPKLTFSPHN